MREENSFFAIRIAEAIFSFSAGTIMSVSEVTKKGCASVSIGGTNQSSLSVIDGRWKLLSRRLVKLFENETVYLDAADADEILNVLILIHVPLLKVFWDYLFFPPFARIVALLPSPGNTRRDLAYQLIKFTTLYTTYPS